MGVVAGHNVSGSNILVEDIMMNDVRNVSRYRCVVLLNPPDPSIEGNLTILYVAGECKYLVYLCMHLHSCRGDYSSLISDVFTKCQTT